MSVHAPAAPISLHSTPESKEASSALGLGLSRAYLSSKDTPSRHSADDPLAEGDDISNATALEIQDPAVAFEVSGAIFSEVPGFVEKIYPALDTSVEADILGEFYDPDARKWKGWPGSMAKGELATWFKKFQEKIQKVQGCTSVLRFRPPGK